jgi:hypothetical protein
MRLLAMCLILGAAAVPASAQPFANATTSRANYTVADATPQKSCESLPAFKGDGIVSIQARVVPAASDNAGALIHFRNVRRSVLLMVMTLAPWQRLETS